MESNIYRGSEKIHSTLIEINRFNDLKLIGSLRMLLEHYPENNIYLHIGRNDDSIDYGLFELLLLITQNRGFADKIILVSFLSQNYCNQFDNLFGYFRFMHLPNLEINDPIFDEGMEDKIKRSLKREFVQGYLKHDIANGKIPKSFEEIFEEYLNQNIIEIVVLDDYVQAQICERIRIAIGEKGLQRISDNELVVTGFSESTEMIKYLKERKWRNVKCVLIDYELRDINNDSGWQERYGADLIEEIKSNNPSIDIWGISVHDPSKERNNTDENFKNFFEHIELCGLIEKSRLFGDDFVNEVVRIINRSIIEKSKTPFFDKFKAYVEESTKSWHVPGHNRGEALSNSNFGKEFYRFFGSQVFKSDHDVPKKFGSIFSPEKGDNVINETQQLVAKTFNAEKTYFVTNGNSASNNIILLSLLKPGDKVLAARSCHKSVHYAMILSGARPTYLASSFSKKYEIMAPPRLSDIEKEFELTGKDKYKLVIVTGCSYEGLVMDIASLKALCDSYGTELFVDEAWYGYSNFHPMYQKTCATRLGVPYVTQSAHKMLSAFRQSAFIHINENNAPSFNEDFFKDIYNTFTSTSPQYQLIASMDVAAMQMRMEGFELIDRAIERAVLFKKHFEECDFKKIKLINSEMLKNEFKKYHFDFDKENIFIDPLKISFDISLTGIDVKDAYNFIKKEAGVDLIKYTKNCIQILFTIGTTFDRNKPAELIRALLKLEKVYSKKKLDPSISIAPIIKGLTYGKKLPRDYFYSERELINVEDAVNRISSTLVTPYPPGIPILLPGEKIKISHIKYIKQIKELGHVNVHGLKSNKIFVVNEEQQKNKN